MYSYKLHVLLQPTFLRDKESPLEKRWYKVNIRAAHLRIGSRWRNRETVMRGGHDFEPKISIKGLQGGLVTSQSSCTVGFSMLKWKGIGTQDIRHHQGRWTDIFYYEVRWFWRYRNQDSVGLGTIEKCGILYSLYLYIMGYYMVCTLISCTKRCLCPSGCF